MEGLYLLLQLFIDLHHRFYLHLRLELHPFYGHLQLSLPLLSLSDPLLVGLSLPLKLNQFLLELDLSVAALVGEHGFILRHEFVREGYLLLLGFAHEGLLVGLGLCFEAADLEGVFCL